MLAKIVGAVIGTKNERELKRMRKAVAKINALEPSIQALSDDQLRQKTEEFKERHQAGESLDKLLRKPLRCVVKRHCVSMGCVTMMCS